METAIILIITGIATVVNSIQQKTWYMAKPVLSVLDAITSQMYGSSMAGQVEEILSGITHNHEEIEM